jgi:hypothetical protein
MEEGGGKIDEIIYLPQQEILTIPIYNSMSSDSSYIILSITSSTTSSITSTGFGMSVNYKDVLGDNILGTNYTLYQNIDGGKSAFEITDLANSNVSNSRTQSFYINDINGSQLLLRYLSLETGFIKNKIVINGVENYFNIIIN